MKKISKKIMAIAMAAVMMSSSITVFAADDQVASGTATGGGQGVGGGKADVFQVVCPTDAGDSFNFILDPQQLLYDYDSDTYDENATVYFGTEYPTDSKELEIINHSSMGVEVSVDAEMATLSGVTMADSDTFEGDDTSLYLALVLGAEDATALTENGMVTSSTSLDPVDKKYFKWDKSPLEPDAKRELDEEAATGDNYTYPATKFHMTGACNSNADWSKLFKSKTFKPTFEVTWTIVPAGDEEAGDKAPSAPTTHRHNVGTASTITVDLGKGDLAATGIKSVKYATSPTGTWTDSAANLTASGNTITISAGLWGSISSSKDQVRYLQVIFNDAAETTIVITVNVNPSN